MNTIIQRLLSRKFITALGSLASCTFLMYNNLIDDGVYSTIMVATVGAYITGNIVQKSTTKETK